MSEPRRIVLILGNGFDLDLGLKTSYKDFWESKYCPKDYPAPLIRHLNSKWGDELESVRWYDLENELLEYALHGDKTDVVNEAERSYVLNHSDVQISIELNYTNTKDEFSSLVEKGYIQLVENYPPRAYIPYKEAFSLPVLERDKKALQLIKDRLCSYLKSIEEPIYEKLSVASNVLLAMLKTVDAGDFVNIYTFNYTHVQFKGDVVDEIPVHYMHGNFTDGNIIVGTHDDLEISAEYDFLQKGMDDYFLPPDLVTALKEADEVIIFGHSLGTNDRQYFAPFFKRQATEDNPVKKDITIFTRDYDSQREIKRALQQMTDGKLSSLYSINQPIIIKTDNLKEDQDAFKDFLDKHHTDSLQVKSIVSWLI